MKTVRFTLSIMFGDHHVLAVHELLRTIPGIKSVYASSAFHIVEVVYDEEKTTAKKINAVLVESGYLDDIDVPEEITSRSENDSDKLFFRRTNTFPQTKHTISFGQDTPSPKRPSWPCPGID